MAALPVELSGENSFGSTVREESKHGRRSLTHETDDSLMPATSTLHGPFLPQYSLPVPPLTCQWNIVSPH
ncbi:hypothetical protein BaRGS_00040024 [Batillaria attramentaria]|uniref:Uncharacterized protein n=1 Tax=Batillaria attramentaria TaxID=370345 RepID=A0ABD0J1P8_9CAEN